MSESNVFDQNAEAYDSWYETHRELFLEELGAIKTLLPPGGAGLEIGVGTGRFAAALGISTGIEPSPAMTRIARKRGIEVFNATAEALPFEAESFDTILMVTTFCFVDDIHVALEEVRRVLKNGGSFVAGIIDRASEWGSRYLETKKANPFYEGARFYSAEEVISLLKQHGFESLQTQQTLFADGQKGLREGYGRDGFVAMRGVVRK